MIMVGERAYSNEYKSDVPGISDFCDADHLRFLRVTIPLILVAAVASLAYIKSTARYLSIAHNVA